MEIIDLSKKENVAFLNKLVEKLQRFVADNEEALKVEISGDSYCFTIDNYDFWISSLSIACSSGDSGFAIYRSNYPEQYNLINKLVIKLYNIQEKKKKRMFFDNFMR